MRPTVKKRHSSQRTKTHKNKQQGGTVPPFTMNSSPEKKIKSVVNTLLANANIQKFLSEIQLSTRPAAVRVAFYKYLDSVFTESLTPREVKSALSLLIPRIFTNVPYRMEGETYNIVRICKDLQTILRFLKSFPKGVSHHDHHYSIVYTERFLKGLLDGGVLERNGLILVFIPKYDTIPKETLELFEGIIPENTLCVFPEGAPRDGLYLVKNDSTITTRLIPDDFSNGEMRYTLRTVQDGLIHINEALSVLQINEYNDSLINTPKKAWAFLEYAAERYKWIVNNYKVVEESWKYAAKIAQEENIQELQVKYTFNLWNWNDEFRIESYDIDTTCLTNEDLISRNLCPADKVRKRYFTELSRFFTRLKAETGVSIHIIVGAARPTNMQTLTGVLCKFNTYNSFNACLSEPLIVGYDMYGQEDVSKVKTAARNSEDLTYLVLLDSLQNFKEKAPNKDDISFTLHAGESYSTDRAGAGIQNLELAAGVNALRIGHGIVLKSSDRLIKVYKEKKILVELCPLSNSLLGFVEDAKKHPGSFLLQKNVLVSISTDNRGILNYDYVSYDWFDLVLFSDLSNKKSRATTKDVYTNLIKIAWDSINSASSIPRINDELRERWTSAYEVFSGTPSRLANSTAQGSNRPFVTAVGRYGQGERNTALGAL